MSLEIIMSCLRCAVLAFYDPEKPGKGHFHLCEFEGVLAFRPHRHTGEAHPIFFTCTIAYQRAGLSGNQWFSLQERMVKFYVKENRCPKLLKP